MKKFFFFIMELVFSRLAIVCGPALCAWLTYLASPRLWIVITEDKGIVELIVSTLLFSAPASLGLLYSVMLWGLIVQLRKPRNEVVDCGFDEDIEAAIDEMGLESAKSQLESHLRELLKKLAQLQEEEPTDAIFVVITGDDAYDPAQVHAGEILRLETEINNLRLRLSEFT